MLQGPVKQKWGSLGGGCFSQALCECSDAEIKTSKRPWACFTGSLVSWAARGILFIIYLAPQRFHLQGSDTRSQRATNPTRRCKHIGLYYHLLETLGPKAQHFFWGGAHGAVTHSNWDLRRDAGGSAGSSQTRASSTLASFLSSSSQIV